MSRCHRPNSCKGVALLYVLGLLTLLMLPCLTLAQLAGTAKVHRSQQSKAQTLDDLVPHLEPLIEAWLVQESRFIVLSLESKQPTVRVLEDVLRCQEEEITVTISAWDQCGMAATSWLQGSSPVAMQLPQALRKQIRALDAAQSLGLDQCVPTTGAPSPFPSTSRETFEKERNEESLSALTLGAVWGPHNQGRGRLNVNTAPRWLLESALRWAGRGGLDVILQNRSQGRATRPSSLPSHERSPQGAPLIAGESNAWAFRIDLQWGAYHRSWWTVYVAERSSWKHAQRLFIGI